jgi:outer membrane protein TolC
MRRSWLGILVLVGLAGCTSPSRSLDGIIARHHEALRKLPEEYRARLQADDEPVTAEPAAQLGPGVLTLEEARRIALQSNPDIHAARARLEAARAQIGEARSLYFPQVELAHTSTRTLLAPRQVSSLSTPFTQSITIPTLPANPTLVDLLNAATSLGGQYLFRPQFSLGESPPFSDHATTLSTSWTLFDGFAREARLLGTKHQYRASAMALADVERLLLRAVDTAYYQWQFARERLRVSQADEEFSREQLADAKRRLAANKLTKATVLNFEVRMRAAQANVVAAKGLRDTAKVVLAELLALPGALMPEGVAVSSLEEETPEELTLPDEEEWIATAMASRPDLAQAQHTMAARFQNIRVAEGQFSPELAFRGTWGFERLHNLRYSEDDQSWALGVELRWALFTGGFRTSQLRRARAEWWEASAQLKRKRLEIASDVRGRIAELADAQEQVRLQRLNLTSAEENRRLVAAEYASGKASLVRLNEAQRDYVTTDLELARARVRLREVWTNLYAAAGMLAKDLGPSVKLAPADLPDGVAPDAAGAATGNDVHLTPP